VHQVGNLQNVYTRMHGQKNFKLVRAVYIQYTSCSWSTNIPEKCRDWFTK